MLSVEAEVVAGVVFVLLLLVPGPAPDGAASGAESWWWNQPKSLW